MTTKEARTLRPGDLVYLSAKGVKAYKGMVFEVAELLEYHYGNTPDVILKQPGFDFGFRHTVRAPMITRYEES